MNIRYGKFFHYPRQIAKHILALIYPIVIKIWPLPNVMSIEETIQEIIVHKKSIVRFGDSEFLYLIDKLNLPYQKYDYKLANEFKQILKSDEDKILVGLPSGYYNLGLLNNEGIIFWKSQISWVYPRLRRYLDRQKTYANASMSRLYIELKDKSESEKLFALVKNIWHNRNLLIVEGEKSRLGVGNDLFENAISIKRILGPAHNAYDKYEEILKEALKTDKNTLVLIAMGPTAKPLAFNLAKFGYQAIDIGNIDIEYEWYKRGVQSKIKIPGKYTSEASGGRIVEDIQDKKYESEIIAQFI